MNTPVIDYSAQELGILKQRMTNVEAGQQDTRAALTSINTKIDERFTALSTKLDERSKTPWSNIISACGVTITVVSLLGIMALAPVKDNLAESRDDYKYLTRNVVVSREEHAEKWRSHDKDIENIRQRIIADGSNFQRQLDEVKSQYGNTYNARDVILQMQNRIDKLESDAAKKS